MCSRIRVRRRGGYHSYWQLVISGDVPLTATSFFAFVYCLHARNHNTSFQYMGSPLICQQLFTPAAHQPKSHACRYSPYLKQTASSIVSKRVFARNMQSWLQIRNNKLLLSASADYLLWYWVPKNVLVLLETPHLWRFAAPLLDRKSRSAASKRFHLKVALNYTSLNGSEKMHYSDRKSWGPRKCLPMWVTNCTR